MNYWKYLLLYLLDHPPVSAKSVFTHAHTCTYAVSVGRNLRPVDSVFSDSKKTFEIIEWDLLCEDEIVSQRVYLFCQLRRRRPSKEPRPDLKAERKDQEQLEKNGINYHLEVRKIVMSVLILATYFHIHLFFLFFQVRSTYTCMLS